MFDIEYKGGNAVVFTTKKAKVLFDPAVSVVGGKDVSVDGAIMVLTEDRFAPKTASPKLAFTGPGEYEASDVALRGIAAKRHIDSDEEGLRATIYRMTIGDIRIAVIGNIAPRLDDDQLESLGVIDLLVLPVGGGGLTLDASDAATIARQVEPKAVVPVHYADSSLKYEVPQEDVDIFVKELGAGVIEAGAKHKIKGSSGLPEQMTVIKIARN